MFWGLLLQILPPMTAIEEKHVPPILYFDGGGFFRCCKFLFQCQPIFICFPFSINSQTHVYALPVKSTNHFYLMSFYPLSPLKDPKYGLGNT